MKKLIILLITLILLTTSVTAITSCYDFSDKVIHSYSFEYGTYPDGKEWYKIKDAPTKLPQPYGYSEAKENRMDSYWQYYEDFKSSFTPKEGAAKYTEYMGSGEMSVNDAAANMADQKLFLEEFTPTEVCHPDFKIEVEEFDDEEEVEDEEEIEETEDEEVEQEEVEEEEEVVKEEIEEEPRAEVTEEDEYDFELITEEPECGPQERWDYISNKCTYPCLDWQEFIKTPEEKVGSCHPRCEYDEAWDEATKTCQGEGDYIECPEDHYWKGDECIKAREYEEFREYDIRHDQGRLNYLEFIKYLEKIEEINPDKTWKHIVSKFHKNHHGMDKRETLPFTWIKLFKDGEETEGWEDVKMDNRHSPRFVDGPYNENIDMSHSYAGMRSDLNRDSPTGTWLMRNCNTNWGDSWQVFIALDWFEEPKKTQAPPWQRKGNDAGIWMAKYYKTEGNEDKPLSEAYTDYFDMLKVKNKA